MKTIMFIGHFKTGSTSIQHYFARNWLALLRKGVLYPGVESQAAARAIRLSLTGRDEDLRGQTLNVIEPHNALALRLKNEEDGHGVPPYYPHAPSGLQMFEMIKNQLDAIQPETMVLCSEVFALLGMTKERKSVKRIHNRFRSHDVKLYCSLRRPDDYLSSWHRQRLKFGEKMLPLRAGALNAYLETAHFQQAKLVRGWLEGGFEEAELVLRNFSDTQKSGGSVVDFMSRTGIPIPDMAVMPGMMNPSVPSAFAEIARLALHQLPQESARSMVAWLIAMREEVDHVADREVEVFGQTMRDMMVERFRPVADDLSTLSGVNRFYPDLEDMALLRPVPELEAARAALAGLRAIGGRSRLTEAEREWLANLEIPAA